ncbi:MAG TPA: hypothetical protein VGL77_11650, partial [Armatimonadota bacterium]
MRYTYGKYNRYEAKSGRTLSVWLELISTSIITEKSQQYKQLRVSDEIAAYFSLLKAHLTGAGCALGGKWGICCGSGAAIAPFGSRPQSR